MKVKYIGIYNNIKKSQQKSSSRLTLGKDYIVIEILSCIKEGVSYRLIGDNKDGSPAIFSAIEFEIISDSVPTNWALTIKKNGLIVNGPSSWRKLGFWENCYSADAAA